jgi:hypothetical protein
MKHKHKPIPINVTPAATRSVAHTAGVHKVRGPHPRAYHSGSPFTLAVGSLPGMTN